MNKSEAIKALGGSISEAARRIRVSRQAISQWPDELTPAMADRVTAALVRMQTEQPNAVIRNVVGAKP